MDDGRCAQIKESGEPCGGYAVEGSIYCFTHDPKSRQKRKEARAAGGKASGKAKIRQTFIREVVGVAQSVPMFEPVDGDLALDTMDDLRTFAILQIKRIRASEAESGGRSRGEEQRHWMNFLLNLRKAELATLQLGRDRSNYGDDGRPSPEPNTLAWLGRIARGPAEGVAGS